jgi:hypothetical protein
MSWKKKDVLKKDCMRLSKSTSRHSNKRVSRVSDIRVSEKKCDMLICKDTSKCFSFNSKNINNLFEYSTFKYYKDPAHQISSGANGIVNILKYEIGGGFPHGCLSTAILKTAIDKEADNLFYEYMVGVEYVNKQLEYFPCFVETYALYTNKEDKKILKKKGDKKLSSDNFKMVTDKTSYEDTCDNSDILSLLIQNIDNSITFNTFRRSYSRGCVIDVLYQVYSVLSVLKDEFTHYDLHSDNVLIYTIPNNEYVKLRYYESDREYIEIETRYIAKIIDYGRCFYKGVKSYLPKSFKKAEECGYNFFSHFIDPIDYYISALLVNKSHDMLLAYSTNKKVFDETLFSKKIIYLDTYGTPPRETDGKTINNVSDVYRELKKMLIKSYHKNLKCIGTLKIYLDRSKKLDFI